MKLNIYICICKYIYIDCIIYIYNYRLPLKTNDLLYLTVCHSGVRDSIFIRFSFHSAHFASFLKIWPHLRGEGISISLNGKKPYFSKMFEYLWTKFCFQKCSHVLWRAWSYIRCLWCTHICSLANVKILILLFLGINHWYVIFCQICFIISNHSGLNILVSMFRCSVQLCNWF